MRRRNVLALLATAVAFPRVSLAQEGTKFARIGYLGPAPAASFAPRVEALRAGLRELGYVEGKSLTFEFRWAEAPERMPELAAELVAAGWTSSSPKPRRRRQLSWRRRGPFPSYSRAMLTPSASAMWRALQDPAAMRRG